MPTLKLGPLPDEKPVRLTVTLSAELSARLLGYARVLAAEQGMPEPPSAERLIPLMLDRFVRSDRAFTAAVAAGRVKGRPDSARE